MSMSLLSAGVRRPCCLGSSRFFIKQRCQGIASGRDALAREHAALLLMAKHRRGAKRTSKTDEYGKTGTEVSRALKSSMGGGSEWRAGRPRDPRRPFLTATNLFIGANALVYMAQVANPSLIVKGWKYVPAMVNNGEWYRLVTPMVLHGGIMHLLVNCYSLYNVGGLMETFLGRKHFVGTYLFSGIAGNVLSSIIDPASTSVGASGGVCGIVGSMAAYFVMNRGFYGSHITQSVLMSTGQTVMLNFLLGMTVSHVDNMGHLGGLLGGAVYTLLFVPRRTTRFF